MNNPKTAIILVNYRTPFYLNLCLKSIFRNTNTDDFRLFLVHNEPDDLSIRIGEKYKRKYTNCIDITIHQKNLGLVGAINSVYEKTCKFDYICLINSDIVVTKNWLDALVYVLDTDKDVVQVTASFYHDHSLSLIEKLFKFLSKVTVNTFLENLVSLLQLNYAIRKWNKAYKQEEANKYDISDFVFDFCSGACNIFRAKFFTNLGYYCDPNIVHGYGDDFDLTYYLRQFGKIAVCNNIFIFHFLNKSLHKIGNGKYYFKTKLQFLNELYVFYKWKDRILRDLQNIDINVLVDLINTNQFFKNMLSFMFLIQNNTNDINVILDINKRKEIARNLGIFA
ncbi:MAG: glycosyltransferase [Candidatus Dojkabacteria bacterium]|nr:glycosyltransferase [Candidatus Dojkabacteria bacterium]